MMAAAKQAGFFMYILKQSPMHCPDGDNDTVFRDFWENLTTEVTRQ